MTDAQDPRYAKLTTAITRLQSDTALKDAASDIESSGRQRDALRRAADALSSKNQAVAGALAETLRALEAAAASTLQLANERLSLYQTALTEQAEALVAAAGKAAGDEAAIAAAESTASALEGQVREAKRDLDALLTPVNTAVSALDRHVSLATLGAEAWAEFSGQRESGEAVLVGANAEWVAGKGRGEAPDGILYLTTSRLIFEQKEKVGKTLGLFGGRKVQEVVWTLPLSDVLGLRAKNEGMLGGRDMLYIEHPGGEYTIEVKGRAKNDDWVVYIERAKSQASPLHVDAPAEPDAAKHAEIVTRLNRERAERVAAAQAALQAEVQSAARAKMADMIATAAAMKAAAESAPKPAAEAPAEGKNLGGLAAALRKPGEPSEPPAKGGEKGVQSASGGASGGNVSGGNVSGGNASGGGVVGGAPKKGTES